MANTIQFLFYVVTSLEILPLVASASIEVSQLGTRNEEPEGSYFRDPTASGLLYAHIILMVFSWVVCLPLILAACSIKSNLWFLGQVFFLGSHAFGLVLGSVYKSKVPNLYPASSHHKIGWTLSLLVILQLLLGVLYITRTSQKSFSYESIPTQPNYTTPLENYHSEVEIEATQSTERSNTLHEVPLLSGRLNPLDRYISNMSWARRWSNITEPHRVVRIFEISYTILSRILPVLGFVAICTGLVTMTGIFVCVLTFTVLVWSPD
jgi:hypothetical protein